MIAADRSTPAGPPRATPAPPPRAAARARRLVALALLVVATYVALVLAFDGRQVAASLARLPPRALLAALALVAAAFALRALRWRLYLLRLGVLPPRGALAFPDAFAMGVASGKWGQVVKAHSLDRMAGVPYAASVPAVLADRVSDVASAVLLLVLGLALAPHGDVRAAALAAVLLVALVTALRHRAVAALLVRLVARVRRLARHRHALAAALHDLRAHLDAARLVPPALLGLAAFLLEALALHVLARGLGLDVGVGAAILLLGTADLAAMLSLLPGGILAAEGSLVALLALQDVPLPEAAVLTLVFRACTLWWGVLLGGAGVAFLQARHARRRPAASSPARSRSI
jgi:uncharacterized protein (TIRG00374 family)